MKKLVNCVKKRKIFKRKIVCFTVTPLAGVWVEIRAAEQQWEIRQQVTPLAGVWVEICKRLD